MRTDPAKKQTPLAGGASGSDQQNGLKNTTYGYSYDVYTQQPKGTALKLSATARVLLCELKPWNRWVTLVQSAPEYFPGAVKTASCRFCSQPHFFVGRVCPDDPGIRKLPCDPTDRLYEWQLPPYPEVTVLRGV